MIISLSLCLSIFWLIKCNITSRSVSVSFAYNLFLNSRSYSLNTLFISLSLPTSFVLHLIFHYHISLRPSHLLSFCHLFASIAISQASAHATCNCCSLHCRWLCGDIYIFFNAFHHYWCCNFINRSNVALPIRSDGRPRFLPINFSCDWSGWIIIQLKLDLSPCFPHICLRLLSCLSDTHIYKYNIHVYI